MLDPDSNEEIQYYKDMLLHILGGPGYSKFYRGAVEINTAPDRFWRLEQGNVSGNTSVYFIKDGKKIGRVNVCAHPNMYTPGGYHTNWYGYANQAMEIISNEAHMFSVANPMQFLGTPWQNEEEVRQMFEAHRWYVKKHRLVTIPALNVGTGWSHSHKTAEGKLPSAAVIDLVQKGFTEEEALVWIAQKVEPPRRWYRDALGRFAKKP